MPTYDYQCSECGHVFELRQSFDSEPLGTCPLCGSLARRKFHAVPIIYKGTGFYTTDYKKSGYSGVSKNENEEDGSKEKAKTAKASTTDSSSDKAEAAKEA